MQKSSVHSAVRRRLPSSRRREDIVAAVLALARDRGPEAITTQAIAERIGVTQGAVFRHFPDKDAIWLAVFAWVRGALLAAVTASVDERRSPLENLERVFEAHVALVSANPGLPRVLFHELRATGDSPVRDAVRSMLDAYRSRLAELFEAAKAARELPPGLDTALATVLFVGAVQGLVIRATIGNEAALGRLAGPMFALLKNGYRGASSAPQPRASRRQARR
jgi:AcrR family transcriptional regulator